MKTYALIENGQEARQIVLTGDDKLPEGDWRPVVVEGLDFDRSKLKEVRRDTRIDPDKVARVVITEPLPLPTAIDVRAEAQRRIIALTGTTDIIGCLTKQHNAQMRATELTLILALGGTWTSEQTAEAAALQGMADQIKLIRAASNAMEVAPPANYADSIHWPSTA